MRNLIKQRLTLFCIVSERSIVNWIRIPPTIFVVEVHQLLLQSTNLVLQKQAHSGIRSPETSENQPVAV